MDAIIQVFDGDDLVIPSELIKKLGVRPGERVQIRPAPVLEPVELEPDERARRLQVLDNLWGSWFAEDEAAFEQAREMMWQTWQPPS